MPFKSKAQRRKFAQLLVEGDISAETYENWNRETGGKDLPERLHPPSEGSTTPRGRSRSRKSASKRRKTSRRRVAAKRNASKRGQGPRARGKRSTPRPSGTNAGRATTRRPAARKTARTRSAVGGRPARKR